MHDLPLLPTHTAVVDERGGWTYADVHYASDRVAAGLLQDRADLEEARVAFLISPGFAYPAVLRGVWRAGGIAVPLSPRYPHAELEYLVRDCGASIVVSDAESEAVAHALAEGIEARHVGVESLLTPGPRPTPWVPRTAHPGAEDAPGSPAAGEGGPEIGIGGSSRRGSLRRASRSQPPLSSRAHPYF